MRSALLLTHIGAGGLAIVLGAVALLARKGLALHRTSGRLFVYAMLAMGMSGSVLALGISLTNANVTGGIAAAYFVVTALTTVRAPTTWTGWVDAAALLVAVVLAAVEIALGVKAFVSPSGTIDGAPYFAVFFMAAVTALAAAGDVRILRSGRLKGAARFARHLWRMCFALFIATASFFSIRARVATIFPEPLTTPAARAVPVLLVLIAMCYWLWRVRFRHDVGGLLTRLTDVTRDAGAGETSWSRVNPTDATRAR